MFHPYEPVAFAVMAQVGCEIRCAPSFGGRIALTCVGPPSSKYIGLINLTYHDVLKRWLPQIVFECRSDHVAHDHPRPSMSTNPKVSKGPQKIFEFFHRDIISL